MQLDDYLIRGVVPIPERSYLNSTQTMDNVQEIKFKKMDELILAVTNFVIANKIYPFVVSEPVLG
jgi:hypothetical protein